MTDAKQTSEFVVRAVLHRLDRFPPACLCRSGVITRKGDDFVYAGKADRGFDKTSTSELRRRLEPLVRKTQPFAKRIAHKGVWVEPKLLAEIECRAKSAEGKVR